MAIRKPLVLTMCEACDIYVVYIQVTFIVFGNLQYDDIPLTKLVNKLKLLITRRSTEVN